MEEDHVKRILTITAILCTFAASSAMAQQGRTSGVDLRRAVSDIQFNEAPLAAAAQAGAAESSALKFFAGTEVTGFVDTYYTYNFNKSDQGNQLYNFNVNHNAFSLNLAELALEKKPTADSRGGFRMDIDYGHAAAMVNSLEPGKDKAELEHIQQAYLSYLAPDAHGVQLDFGKFVTQHGAEVIETKDNWNYSRSLLFAWAIPYYHMGVRATIPINDKFTFAAVIVNGWNNVFENNTGKTVGLQAVIKPTSSVTIVQNYMGGPEQAGDNDDWRHLLDTLVTFNASSMVSVMGNYDYGRDTASGSDVTWQGFAGYLKIQPNSWFAFIPRAEYFDDKDGFATGTAQKVKEVTATAEIKHRDGVMMRVEYRRDFSDQPFFTKNTNESVKNQDTFSIGWVYAFSSKTP